MPSSDKKSINIRSQRTYRLSYVEQRTEGNTYRCHACLQRGWGPYYLRKSDGCKYYYHPCCGELLRCDSSSATPVGKHPLYPNRNLVLKETEPRKVQSCVVCSDKVQMLRYNVQDSRKTYGAFHPLCASLPLQIKVPGEHGIVLDLNRSIQGECLICNDNSTGWAYNTAENHCCHVRCMKKKITTSLRKKETSQKNKVIIYVKKALRLFLKIAKVALQVIADCLLGFPSSGIVGLIIEVLSED